MNIRKYFIITDTNKENSNPGDILIGNGIEYLIRKAEKELDNLPIINYINIFKLDDIVWQRVYDEADYLVLCGTPHFNKNGVNHIFNLFPNIKKAHDLGIVTSALWVGSGYTEIKYTEDTAVEELFKVNKEVIEEYRIFDLIITRDKISTKIFEKAHIEATQLCDSVFFASDYYSIEARENNINLLVLRDMPNLEKQVVEVLEKLGDQLEKGRPLFYLCHTVRDFNVYKDLIKGNIICINNPKDLLEMYSRANQVISFRIHGTIPSINFGKSVINIGVDSRDNILAYFKGWSKNFNEVYTHPQLILKKYSTIDIQEMKESDSKKFMQLFYEKCQVKYGRRKLKESTQYCSREYWTGTGRSNYGVVPKYCTTKSKEIADELINLKWTKGLELGCAGGHNIAYLDRGMKLMYGLDVSEHAIEEGKRMWPKIADRIQVGSIDNLSIYADGEFELVYSQQVLEHLPTELVPKLISELTRVTTQNAILILYLVLGYKEQIAKAETDLDQTHWNLKTKEWWRKEFEKKGFYIDEDLMKRFEEKGKGLHRILLRRIT